MSLTDAPGNADGAVNRTAESTVSADALIDVLSDDEARAILEAVRTEPKSARALATECGVSRPTAYRRLNRLLDAGLLTERMEYDSDGHHRRTFGLAFEAVGITLGDDGFEADIDAVDPSPSHRR